MSRLLYISAYLLYSLHSAVLFGFFRTVAILVSLNECISVQGRVTLIAKSLKDTPFSSVSLPRSSTNVVTVCAEVASLLISFTPRARDDSFISSISSVSGGLLPFRTTLPMSSFGDGNTSHFLSGMYSILPRVLLSIAAICLWYIAEQ